MDLGRCHIHIKRDLYAYQKRLAYTKRDLYTPKETFKRDLETQKKTYVHQKRVLHTPENPKIYGPGQVQHTYQKRPTKETYRHRKRRIYTKRDQVAVREFNTHQKRP